MRQKAKLVCQQSLPQFLNEQQPSASSPWSANKHNVCIVLKCCQSHSQTSPWICKYVEVKRQMSLPEELKHFADNQGRCAQALRVLLTVKFYHLTPVSCGFFLSSHISVASQHSLSSSCHCGNQCPCFIALGCISLRSLSLISTFRKTFQVS